MLCISVNVLFKRQFPYMCVRVCRSAGWNDEKCWADPRERKEKEKEERKQIKSS